MNIFTFMLLNPPKIVPIYFIHSNHKEKEGWLKNYLFVVINIMPQMLSIQLNFVILNLEPEYYLSNTNTILNLNVSLVIWYCDDLMGDCRCKVALGLILAYLHCWKAKIFINIWNLVSAIEWKI